MKIIKCKTPDEIALLCANKILNLLKNKNDAILGLATGSTPVKTYRKLIELSKQDNVSFKNVKTFNLDEYINYKNEIDSYKYFMYDNLFKHIDIDLNNTHFPNEMLLDKYDDQIEKAGGVDLQILGIGANGHIAFNEPNTPFDSKTHVVGLSQKTIEDNARFFNSIDEVPTSAITMGLATIMKSKEIILIATGKNKADAINKLINEKPSLLCPASILQNHPNVTIYVDDDSASLL